ncbi:MAG: hypothetical protein KJP08_02590 [Gammaproteobacteria bacterium]|nr:hypothetical protein [Gammaproteobacteria bacterium]
MSRAPLAYPLNRAADADVGGAGDLQTDVMRFMAILALCLVAIFALVQSIPLTPVESQPEAQAVGISSEPQAPVGGPSGPQAPVGGPSGPNEFATEVAPTPLPATPVEEPVVLTRPKWVPKYTPPASEQEPSQEPAASPVGGPSGPNEFATEVAPARSSAAPVEDEGFTLRFASDAALMRSVAAHRVGVYAIDAGRARRMTVSESRISFWDASTPNSFHEMEADTVPVSVVGALARSGAASGSGSVQWGVTLPGSMTAQLDALMQEHRGGELVIGAGGTITWEASR